MSSAISASRVSMMANIGQPIHWPVISANQYIGQALNNTIVISVNRLNLPFFQPNLSSDNLSQPSSSNTRPDQTRPHQGCGEYQTSGILSGAMPYGPQSYSDPPVSIAYTSNIEQLASSSVPFLYPLPCHKFGYYTTTSVTPTVITHTASTMGAQGSVHQAHGYTHTGDTYPLTPCHSLSYPAAVSDPVHAVLPSATAAHCFSVPEQVAVTGVRGKHKQKTGGVRTAGPPLAPSGPPSTAPTSTSCLAKLLSSGAGERESVLSVLFILTSFYSSEKISRLYFLSEEMN